MPKSCRFIRVARAALCAFVLAPAAMVPHSAIARPSLEDALRNDLRGYLAQRGRIEHISAASLSVSLSPSKPNIDVAAGTTTYGGSIAATPQNLVQIGSNTKAFTSVMLLELEAQRRLSIDDTLGRFLPQYPAWKNITIRRLLNMTSGIPTYDDVGSFLARYAANPNAFITTNELVATVYPRQLFTPGKRWYYSNTAYILSQMIIERVTGTDYAHEIASRFIDGGPQLADTYYFAGTYPASITRRMVAGYFFSHDPVNRALAPLLGRDVRDFSLSWAQGAGGIVASPHAITQWVRALYESPMLAPAQRRELLTLVSNSTGAPIAAASAKNPRGFGLGVGQLRTRFGIMWYYEGETLGYRMLYAYLPHAHAVIAVALNSQPDAKQDRIGTLVESAFSTLQRYGEL